MRALADRGDPGGHRHKGRYGVESTRLGVRWPEESVKPPGLRGDVYNRERRVRNMTWGLCSAGNDRWL